MAVFIPILRDCKNNIVKFSMHVTKSDYKSVSLIDVKKSIRFSSKRSTASMLSSHSPPTHTDYRWCAYWLQTCKFLHFSSTISKQKQTLSELREKQRNQISRTAPVLDIWKNMTVKELSEVSGRSLDLVFEAMLYVENCDDYDTPNSAIEDINVLANIAKKLGYRTKIVPSPHEEAKHKVRENKDAFKRPPPNKSQLVKRPPVVTIMGHVDHGKTTLLDSLRHTSVVQQEFGGITQHIGAFIVKLANGEKITFLDTPGHAAFSAMRARGAHVTDIVVLVVAADDGVMEQTVESIRYAREAGVPLIVAVNKMDKPEADVEVVKKGLLSYGVQFEDMGGDTQYVCISALKGTNLDQLADAILVQAEIMNICGDPKGMVEGVVIESSIHPGRGKLATVLIQRGTLRKGAILVCGTTWGKVRAMFDEWGQNVNTAMPSTPVQVIGWREEIPSAGDEILEVESERRAREVVEWRKHQINLEKQKEDQEIIQKKLEEHLKVYKEELQKRREEGRMRRKKSQAFREKLYKDDSTPKLSLIVKGDVDGSVEAILDILDTYHAHAECRLDVVHYGVGAITENDLELAETFNSIIYGFNVVVPEKIAHAAKEKKINVKVMRVIYKLVDDIKERINERLPLVDKEEVFGEANVLQEFLITEGKKKVPVAGCRCTKGILKKSAMFRLVRNGSILHEGPLASMRHLKDEVKTVKLDLECGLMLQDPSVRFMQGDTLICYTINKVAPKTEWDPGF